MLTAQKLGAERYEKTIHAAKSAELEAGLTYTQQRYAAELQMSLDAQQRCAKQAAALCKAEEENQHLEAYVGELEMKSKGKGGKGKGPYAAGEGKGKSKGMGQGPGPSILGPLPVASDEEPEVPEAAGKGEGKDSSSSSSAAEEEAVQPKKKPKRRSLPVTTYLLVVV